HHHQMKRQRGPAMRTTTMCAVVLAAATAALLAAPTSTRAESAGDTQSATADTATLRRTLERVTAGYRGVVGISMRNLASGETLSLGGHETFPTASLIKVPILVTLLDEVHEG